MSAILKKSAFIQYGQIVVLSENPSGGEDAYYYIRNGYVYHNLSARAQIQKFHSTSSPKRGDAWVANDLRDVARLAGACLFDDEASALRHVGRIERFA